MTRAHRAYLPAVMLAALLLLPGVASAISWQIASLPAATQADSSLLSVACSSLKACTAVGHDASGVLVLRGPTTWSAQTAPSPAGSESPAKARTIAKYVSCPTARACVTVGRYTNRSGNPGAFGERWNGTAWSLTPMPDEGDDTGTVLGGLACFSATDCLTMGDQAIGLSEPMGETDDIFTEQFNGSRWVDAHPRPVSPETGGGAESGADQVNALACSALGQCTAVGYAYQPEDCPHCGVWAQRLGPSGWTLQKPSQHAPMHAVACPTSTSCVAVGGATSQVWNGSTWTVERIPSAAGGSLNAISCPAAGRCVAAGQRRRAVLIEEWNGSAWSQMAVPKSSGVKGAIVNGVSCPTVSTCVLVGSSNGASGGRKALVVRFA